MRWERWRAHSGVAAITLALGGILVATVVSPSFAWGSDALSDLGVAWSAAGTRATARVFNGGLLAGGAAGLVFTRTLAATARTRPERVVAVLFGLTVVLMGLVFGTVNLLAWAVWAGTGPLLRDGVAIPEAVGALALAGWVLTASVRPL